MSESLSLSFFDIQAMDVSQDVKDELTLGFLHGLDLHRYVTNSSVDFRVLRGIRLCLEHAVPSYIVKANLKESVLLGLFEVYSSNRTLMSTGLDAYFHARSWKLTIEESTFEELVKLSLSDIQFGTVDFNKVPLSTVAVFASALAQGIDVSDIQGTRASKDKDYLEFLLSLRQSDIDISPFLNGVWSEEQVTAVIQGRSKISTVDFVKNYVNEFFTEGQIEYCVRAVDHGCLDLVSSVDEDGYPIFNEYQMYNIVEGARFGLDYMSYADPNLNDHQMSMKRNALFSKKDSLTRGSLSSKLVIDKPLRRV